jgi:hypothetical protein
MTALQRIETIGSDVLVRMRAIDKEEINLVVKLRVIETGTIAE